MKKILLTLAAGLISCSVFGQGITFSTRGGGVDARVTDTLTGAFAEGTAYSAQLYYGAAGAAEASLVPVLQSVGGPSGNVVTFATGGTLGGYIFSGLGGAGARYVDTAVVAAGNPTAFQVRAWQTVLGATWEAALANWSATTVMGKSAVITTPTAASATLPSTPLLGLTAFTLDPVPEPSVIALGAIGLVALLWRRRK